MRLSDLKGVHGLRALDSADEVAHLSREQRCFIVEIVAGVSCWIAGQKSEKLALYVKIIETGK